MKIRIVVVCAGALLIVPVIRSQVSSSAGGAAASKVGVISMQGAIMATAEGKQASAELQSRFAARSTELQNLQKQLQDLQAKMQSPTTSDQEKGKAQADGERLNRAYTRKQQYFQDDLTNAQQEIGGNIGRQLLDVISQYARDNGYTVILDTSAQQTPVVWVAAQVDVTQEVVKLFDQKHPAKAEAVPAKPATPPVAKPAPKP
ncbi:MAG TPA: OmpH family outer membrane protein [Dongiaceae bacterium]|nr:OmpH family outer membrane protein [Dongiaceae bacterium]